MKSSISIMKVVGHPTIPVDTRKSTKPLVANRHYVLHQIACRFVEDVRTMPYGEPA